MFFHLADQMAASEDVTEQLKSENKNAVGTENEQYSEQGNGDRKSAFDLRRVYREAGSNPRLFIQANRMAVYGY